MSRRARRNCGMREMESAQEPPIGDDAIFAFTGTALRREEGWARQAAGTGPQEEDLVLLLDEEGRAPFAVADGRIRRLPAGRLGRNAADRNEWAFLGVDASGRRHWAAFLRAGAAESVAPAVGSVVWWDPRRLAHHLTTVAREGGRPDHDSGDLALARALLFWHRDHRHCPTCGAATAAVEAGFARRCGACGHVAFARVDPAVLVLVHAGACCVLARGRGFPEGMYSTIAGFLRPGESLEQAAARETHEELGLCPCAPARYVASQPWPFPHSLMAGFLQEVKKAPIRRDEAELADARWFRREEVVRLLEDSAAGHRGALFVPPPLALAHHLIALWARR